MENGEVMEVVEAVEEEEDKNLKIHDLLRQLCLSKFIYDQQRVILLSTLEEKHNYRMRHSNGIIRTFISMQVDIPK
ncbi:hypothetical protein H5410_021969 [Solanum commersonii]|uniref:Uncharacterized protein n=1 Tax=Solanum commersonii TaxID=4109 RepID=A0A9J5ZFS9_SOLCO|nr:hypothetical protein H5410_021969 [Solanum commersonii]